VAPKLRRFMAELRPFTQDAQPTIRDLSQLIQKPGPNNDLIDLVNSTPAVRDIACGQGGDPNACAGTVQANGHGQQGAFPASTQALQGATPELGFARPYAVDLTGWFDDFSHSGLYDALGGASRASPHASAFALLNGGLLPVPPSLRGQVFDQLASLKQNNRCPGAADHNPDGSVPFKPSPDYNCNPSQVLPGP
jgi:phospholipid/cholesterol/gamma-HCH transport system substrate-binding protein